MWAFRKQIPLRIYSIAEFLEISIIFILICMPLACIIKMDYNQFLEISMGDWVSPNSLYSKGYHLAHCCLPKSLSSHSFPTMGFTISLHPHPYFHHLISHQRCSVIVNFQYLYLLYVYHLTYILNTNYLLCIILRNA